MIFSAGLSPAWQQILQFDTLQPGAVNRAVASQWCASGKVINVALAAKMLGERSTLLSMIGGHTGTALAEDVAAADVQADWIETDSPTRVCTTLLEASGLTTELVENVGPVAEEVLSEFVDRFRTFAQVAEVTILTGSMPANVPDDYNLRLLRNVPARMILDIRGPGLMQVLPLGPWLVKPNREELEQTLESPLDDEAALLMGMRQLNNWGAAWVVISDGPHALYLTGDEQAWKIEPPTVDLVNPIGCGDCLAAGIAVGVVRGLETLEAVKFGVAAAAYNATQLLPARLCEETVSQWAETITATLL